jgi:hypothetical protein
LNLPDNPVEALSALRAASNDRPVVVFKASPI